MSEKRVYLFGNGKAEGNAKMREELGGKGANLAEMNHIGVPVPPGFTITTDCCNEYYQVGQEKIMEILNDDVMAAVKHIEDLMNCKFGDAANPLLVSVRSGARASMPGMMDTILNLGLNDEVAEGMAKKTNNPHFVYDSYRRFVQMYGDVVLEMKPVNKEDIDPFEEIIEKVKKESGVVLDKDLSVEDLKKLVQLFKAAIKERTGKDFPNDPIEQLWGAICAVFPTSGVQPYLLWQWYSVTWATPLLLVYASAVMPLMVRTYSMVNIWLMHRVRMLLPVFVLLSRLPSWVASVGLSVQASLRLSA